MKKLVIAALLFVCIGCLYAQVWKVEKLFSKEDLETRFDADYIKTLENPLQIKATVKNEEGIYVNFFIDDHFSFFLNIPKDNVDISHNAVIAFAKTDGSTLAVKSTIDKDSPLVLSSYSISIFYFKIPGRPKTVIPNLEDVVARSLGVDKYGYFEDLVEFLIPPGAVEMAVTDGEKSYTFTINTAGFAEAFAKL